MKRVILVLLSMVVLSAPAMAAITPVGSAGTPYLSIVSGSDSDFYQFDERGVYRPQTDPPTELREGWIVLSGQEPLTITGREVTIVLQRESILTIGSTRANDRSFYLVAGSASFLVEPPFSGSFEVSTPVGIYRLSGPGEMFVSSDYAELIFSLGGEIQVMNAITRQITEIPSFSYLNLADPFLNPKEISQQTYQTLSIRPDRDSVMILPSATVQDGVTFKAPEPLFPVVSEPAQEPTVLTEEPTEEPVVQMEATETVEPTTVDPVEVEPETQVETKEIIVPEPPSQGLAITVSITADPTDQAEELSEPEVAPMPTPVVDATDDFNVYIVHTNDIMGSLSDEGSIGFAKLATLLDWGRELSDRNLLLDAGNTVSGSPVADSTSGETVAVLLDMLGYDAIAPGPADYAFGFARLQEAAQAASQFSSIKVLAANILDAHGYQVFEPYGIYDLKGYTVGVIGVSVPPQGLAIDFVNEAVISQAQLLVDEVSEQADFIVLLGNIGTYTEITSTDIASSISGIDLIIDGETAKTPSGGRIIGETLIVNAGAQLSSVGVVDIQVQNGEVEALYAARIAAEDVLNPESSTLASSFGIVSVPEKPEVRDYIAAQEAAYAARQTSETPVVAAEQTDDTVTTEEEVVETADEALTIREPLGIVSGPSAAAEDTVDWGVKMAFNFSRDGGRSSSAERMGFSINPFFNHNAFAMGLQAFFLTEGGLFSPSTYTIENLRDESGTAATVSSMLRFIDYIRYGQQDYAFYLLADDTTPISFGNRLMVNKLGVASGPYEEHLGLYSTINMGNFGLEVFMDDLYLTNWLEGNAQTGGARLTYQMSPSVSLGLSSIVTADRARTMNAYPALDLTWTIKNERRLRVDAFMGGATKISVDDFSFDTVFDSAASGIGNMFPNFLLVGGMDFRTLSWNFRGALAVQNSQDPLVSYGSFNQTRYSGERLLDRNAGIHYMVAGEATYAGDRFGFSTSWDIPIEHDFSRIIPIDSTSSTGDRFAAELSYTTDNFQAALGFRRVGMFTAIENLFTSGSIRDGVVEFLRSSDENLQKNSEPYVALRYTSGLFGIHGDLSLVNSTGTSFVPRINLGATVTLGKRAIADAVEQPSVKETGTLSGSMETAYTRAFVSGGSDDHYLTLRPRFTYAKGDSFSFGIGPHLTFNSDDLTALYAHDDSPFGFGTDYVSTVGKVYDSLTDALSLIDHVTLGSEEDTFSLAISRDQEVSMGPLVKQVSTRTDGILDSPLAMQAHLHTDLLNVDLFMNDISELQLGGVRMGVSPLRSYKAEIGLSAIGSLALSDTDKQLAVLPGVEVILPVLSKDTASLDISGSFNTLIGYEAGSGFTQNFYDSSASTFLGRFNNYLFSGGMNLKVRSLQFGLDIAMHEGALSYGMFNTRYLREQKDLIADLDLSNTATTPRSFTIGATAGIEKEKFSLKSTYLMPLSADFAFDSSRDLLTVSGLLSLSWFDLELAYSRRGFSDALNTMFTGSASLASRAKSFLFDTNSAFSAKIAVEQGPMTFSATASALADFTTDTGTWNQQTVNTVSPALTLGVDITLF